MSKLLPVFACALALGLAACGDDDSDTNGDTGAATGATTEATTERTATAGRERTATVVMRDIEFKPASITVERGTTVTWPNEDSFDHNVTKRSGPGPDFRSDDYGQGESYEHTFNTSGTIRYTCTLHPGMDGSVTVR